MEITLFATISAFLLFTFIGAGVARFGLLDSYSAYASKWKRAVPMNNLNLWSIVTGVAAFLMFPPLLEVGVGSMWQFLGFLIPLYLIIVTLTPNWATNLGEYKVHASSALVCLVGALVWCLVVMHAGRILLSVAAFVAALALFSGSAKRSAVFWVELHMFLSVYLTLLLALL